MTRRLLAGGWTLALLLMLGGCPLPPVDDGPPLLDQEPNETFDAAVALVLDDGNTLRFGGNIDTTSDTDLYRIDSLNPGDRLIVDVRQRDSQLDAVLIVFDTAGNMQAFNDDRAIDGSDVNPFLDFVVNGQQGAYYIGITAFQGGRTSGGYEVGIQVIAGSGPAGAAPAVVYLNWLGGLLDSVTLGTTTLPPFSATQVGLSAADTVPLKQQIEALVRSRYANYDITIVSSDSGPRPTAPHSTVFFGGDNSRAFALAEQIDVMNTDADDVAIIYTEPFRTAFGRQLTRDELATAMGNTVAHEIGHLLGLVHTRDCLELMDATCSNNALLLDQQFGRARLDTAVFPIGWQDAVDWLTRLLGWSA